MSSPAPQFESNSLPLSLYMVQLSHPYMTTGKTIVLTIWSFVGKVMSLLFKTLSSFVIAFLLKSKCLWISWLQSPSAVILEPKKTKSAIVSTFSPSIWHMMDVMILLFECWDIKLDRWFKQMILVYIEKKQLEIWTRYRRKTTDDDSLDAMPSVSRSHLALCNPMDCRPPGSSV